MIVKLDKEISFEIRKAGEFLGYICNQNNTRNRHKLFL